MQLQFIHKYIHFICNVNQVLNMNISKDSGFKFMEQKCPEFFMYYNPEVFFNAQNNNKKFHNDFVVLLSKFKIVIKVQFFISILK